MQQGLRPGLSDLPDRMLSLPIDERGYPVPAFVDTQPNGTRDFRFMSQKHWTACVALKLCWVCGGKLGAHITFVLGPMCGISRTTSEPPCHTACARWSARFCPFLARPHMVRREDDLTRANEKNVAGCPITRNPGVALLWTSKDRYQLFNDGKGRPLIRVGEPYEVEWWAQGREATFAEVEHSICTGLPKLLDLAVKQGDEAVAELMGQVKKMQPLMPANPSALGFPLITCECGQVWTQEMHTVCPRCARWPKKRVVRRVVSA